jgi:dTDP-4-amino-4,6-dideoxygalactose transaminase
VSCVRFYEPSRAYEAQREELDAAFHRVLGSDQIVLGPEVAAFEYEFAERVGTSHAVGVASGTDALELALRALELPAGTEVLCPNLTAIATPTAISRAGHRPVLVDTDGESLNLDPAQATVARSAETAAIAVVHLYGRPAPVEELRELGLPIVEDASHAHGFEIDGRPAGSIGDVGCFSFYPTKNLGAFGDGGAVVTSDEALARRVRALRAYGATGDGRIGANSRLDELQAAFLRVRLQRLDHDNRRRAELAAAYDRVLDRQSPDGAHHLYVIRSGQREELRSRLDAAGVETAIHYPATVHEHPLFASSRRADELSVSTQAAREVVSLPCYPHLTDAEQSRVIEALQR